MKDIILAGIQGSGKGVQSKKLLETYKNQIVYFETGNILRALMCNNNAIGEYLKNIVNSGHLVPDNIVIGLFKVFLETTGNKNILCDGNLRRMGQTKGILNALTEKKRTPLVIWLTITEEEVYKRLTHRKICKNCGSIFSNINNPELKICGNCGGELSTRTDDSEMQAIKTRIDEYKRETVPALEYVEKLGYLVKIDGMLPIEEVFKKIQKLVEN